MAEPGDVEGALAELSAAIDRNNALIAELRHEQIQSRRQIARLQWDRARLVSAAKRALPHLAGLDDLLAYDALEEAIKQAESGERHEYVEPQ